jgi:hypothetical protein
MIISVDLVSEATLRLPFSSSQHPRTGAVGDTSIQSLEREHVFVLRCIPSCIRDE